MFGEEKDSVLWVERIRKAPCTSWDYPKLVWSNLAWRVSTSHSHLVSSPDHIRRVYHFQYNVHAILKVIRTGIGFGSGTETNSHLTHFHLLYNSLFLPSLPSFSVHPTCHHVLCPFLHSLSVYPLQYLPAIQAGSSPLLHTHTFLLARLSHLLFELGRAWSVSELTINTLHCMARQIKQLKVGWSHDCHVMSCDLEVNSELS